MIDVDAQHRLEVAASMDEHTVGTLSPQRADEPLEEKRWRAAF